MAKSIACRQELTILEIEGADARGCALGAESLGRRSAAAFVAAGSFDNIRPDSTAEGCVEDRVHAPWAVLTLVGDRVARAPGIRSRAEAAPRRIPVVILDAAPEASLFAPSPVSEPAIVEQKTPEREW